MIKDDNEGGGEVGTDDWDDDSNDIDHHTNMI